jgi:hypothetical protein
MPDKAYVVKLKSSAKPSDLASVQTIVASTAEIHDEHLIFCDARGELTALFLMEVVQSWNELSGARVRLR